MNSTAPYLMPSEAAERLGLSQKALRLYEQRGLLKPLRTEAGWRIYGPAEMARASEIAALRALGLSLAQVERVLKGEQQGLETALAIHQRKLEQEARHLSETLDRLRNLRSELAAGEAPKLQELARLARPAAEVAAAFDLPWPWGGERFELRDIKPLTYIIGPLGSGKTRLAMALAEHMQDAVFIGLDRVTKDAAAACNAMDTDGDIKARVERICDWLAEDGATPSPALTALLVALETDPLRIKVIDMVEQGLDQATQEAVIAYLRQRGPNAVPLLLMTRSSAILDLGSIGPDEAILLCPANHSPPMRVAPYPGAPGYEAAETCLGPPDVRARTEGVIAFRPNVA